MSIALGAIWTMAYITPHFVMAGVLMLTTFIVNFKYCRMWPISIANLIPLHGNELSVLAYNFG